VTLDDFFPFVMPSAKGCTEPVAAFAIRNAIIELCREALVWQEWQPVQPSTAGLVTYDFALADQQQFVKLLAVTVNKLPLHIVDPQAGREAQQRGSTESFAFGLSSGFTVNPVFADDLPIRTFCAVCPTLQAELVSDDLERYAEAIAHGALSKLLMIPKRDFTDAATAGIKLGQWEAAKSKAKTDVLKGFARSNPRTRAVWF
jgi:hypothetical protein